MAIGNVPSALVVTVGSTGSESLPLAGSVGLGTAPTVALRISDIHKYATLARGLRFLSSSCL